MKYLYYILLLLLNSIYSYGIDCKEFNISLNISDFSVNMADGFVYIESNKYLCAYGGDTAEPALPYISINILIGRNDIYNGFTCSSNEKDILNGVTIINNTEETPTDSIAYPNTKPSISYSKSSYPNTTVKYAGLYDADGYRFVSFLISPFRYDNINKTLYFEDNISIVLKTRVGTSQTEGSGFHRRISQDRIRDFVINGEDVSLLYPSGGMAQSVPNRSNIQYDYIIITNNSLEPTFLRLADWKTRKGIRTKVLTTEHIDTTYTGDSYQQKIKAAIKSYYDNCPSLKYVLLAGDVDVVPAQMCVIKYIPNDTTYYESDCPVDLYYANLGTMNWDGDGNGVYGEPNDVVSPYPQIAITRAPVSSVSDAETFVNRIIDYEASPNIEGWSNNILMCGNILKVYYTIGDSIMSDAHYKGETFYTDYIAPYWNRNKVSFYDTGTDIPGVSDYEFIPQNIQKELSKGYKFVNMATHGNPTAWKTEGARYSTDYADTLNNSNHTIIITTACLTNAFDSIPKCLSESFIRNPNSNVVSYFGCSRLGWYNKYIYNYGTSEKVNMELYRIMFNGNEKNFGEIVRQTKANILSHCNNYNTPYRWLLFGLNPIGDPEMPIFTNTPQKFTNVTVSYTNGTLTVNSGVDDCKICVASAYDMGDSYYDIRTGMSASFSNLTNEYSICITKTGYVPYLAKCGNTVYMQNESINTDYKVFSNQTVAGSNVTASKPNGPVEINKGNTIIKSTNGVTINNNFEIKNGATLEIQCE